MNAVTLHPARRSLTSVCACGALTNPQPSGYEIGMAKETRWDRKSEARVRRAVLNNPSCPSAQDRLDLKAKAAADQYEQDGWERGAGPYDEGWRDPRCPEAARALATTI